MGEGHDLSASVSLAGPSVIDKQNNVIGMDVYEVSGAPIQDSDDSGSDGEEEEDVDFGGTTLVVCA